MKKLISAVVLTIIITGTVNAQNENDYASSYNLKKKGTGKKDTVLPAYTTSLDFLKNKFGINATTEFAKFNTNAKNIVWDTIAGGGFIAWYKINQNNGRRYYSKKGRFLCNILNVESKDLPIKNKTEISTTYPDFSITSTEEFTMPSKIFYIVHIENKKEHKKIRLSADAGIEIVQENFN